MNNTTRTPLHTSPAPPKNQQLLLVKTNSGQGFFGRFRDPDWAKRIYLHLADIDSDPVQREIMEAVLRGIAEMVTEKNEKPALTLIRKNEEEV